jgi:hypothetical protein
VALHLEKPGGTQRFQNDRRWNASFNGLVVVVPELIAGVGAARETAQERNADAKIAAEKEAAPETRGPSDFEKEQTAARAKDPVKLGEGGVDIPEMA